MYELYKKIQEPSNLTDEELTQAYTILKEHCDENNTDVLTLVNNSDNIKPASIEIQSKLPWLMRKMISAEKIEELITVNIDFIREKAEYFHSLEKKAKKKKK